MILILLYDYKKNLKEMQFYKFQIIYLIPTQIVINNYANMQKMM